MPSPLRPFVRAACVCLAILFGGVAWYEQPAFRQARLNAQLVADVKADDVARVRADLSAGADPNARRYFVHPISFRARLLSFFRQSQDPPLPPQWEPVLDEAAERGNTQIVQALLDRGADVNGKDSTGYATALGEAAWGGQIETGAGHPNLVALLLAHGADTSAKSIAVHYTTWSDDLDSMTLLLDSGANANDETFGFTPLSEAVIRREAALVELLLKHGADPNLVSKGDKYSPLTIAERHPQVNAQIIQMLRRAGARP